MSVSECPGFEIPVRRSLTEPVLMAGAPRTAAIVIGTLAAAVGLGLQLWIPGLLIWALGHSAAVFMARRHNVRAHSRMMTGVFVGGLIVAGLFAFMPGRLLFSVFFAM